MEAKISTPSAELLNLIFFSKAEFETSITYTITQANLKIVEISNCCSFFLSGIFSEDFFDILEVETKMMSFSLPYPFYFREGLLKIDLQGKKLSLESEIQNKNYKYENILFTNTGKPKAVDVDINFDDYLKIKSQPLDFLSGFRKNLKFWIKDNYIQISENDYIVSLICENFGKNLDVEFILDLKTVRRIFSISEFFGEFMLYLGNSNVINIIWKDEGVNLSCYLVYD